MDPRVRNIHPGVRNIHPRVRNIHAGVRNKKILQSLAPFWFADSVCNYMISNNIILSERPSLSVRSSLQNHFVFFGFSDILKNPDL
jgi:hypothetical protein